MKHRGKKAILYRRVSTSDQKDFGFSLSQQQARLTEWCKKNEVIVVKDFEEDHSAKDFNRPAYKELLKYVKKNKNQIDFLLVHKWDRFSRNVLETLIQEDNFKKIGIQVNAIDEWADPEIPQERLMQLLHSGIAEVDNRIRRQKTMEGMNRALREGRYILSQPTGYIPGKDQSGKTLMQVNVEIAPLIKSLFEDYATGLFSQSEILTKYLKLGLKISKSSLSTMLKNPLYMGKVFVPAFEDSPEELVVGLHTPIISESTFYKVQAILNRKGKLQAKPKTNNDLLPLRGFLKCPKCGRNLTGSPSRSHTGALYYYYHCNRRCKCNISFRADKANRIFSDELKKIQPSEEALTLFRAVLMDQLENGISERARTLKTLKQRLKHIENNLESLTEKFIENMIAAEVYQEYKLKYEKQKYDIMNEMDGMSSMDDDLRKQIEYLVFFLQNLDHTFENASVDIKQKLLSSILAEKLVFDGEKYRTLVFKEVLSLIARNNGSFQKLEKIKGRTNNQFSRKVAPPGLEPGSIV